MNKRVLAIQSDNCNGCHLCELACSSTKEGEFILYKSRIRVVTNGLEGWSRPVVCLQCEEPMCMAVCSVDAIYKIKSPQGDNIVSIDKEKCIGCHQCVVVCPFGAIEYLKEEKAIKCDLCGGSPVCVNFCFYDCLNFIELSDEAYQKRSRKIKLLTTKACREISKREPQRRRGMFSLDVSNVIDF
ncbi:MAG: 4Fe-4S dicluster domain-containing protein [Candidatus Hodarchaeota archaeon]